MEIEVSEKEKRRSDPYIWGIIIILYIVSVVEVYSAISREITGGDVYSPIIKHIMLLFSGFVITYVTSQIHYKWFKVLAYLMIPLTIVLLVSILFWGDTINGAKRTISVLGVSLQGSEVAKVTIVLAMATVLAKTIDKARGKYEGRFMGGRSGDDIQRFAVYSGADQHVAIYRDKCLHDADRGCRIL